MADRLGRKAALLLADVLFAAGSAAMAAAQEHWALIAGGWGIGILVCTNFSPADFQPLIVSSLFLVRCLAHAEGVPACFAAESSAASPCLPLPLTSPLLPQGVR